MNSADWVTAAMAGRGSDTPPPPVAERDHEWAWAIVWTVTFTVMTVAAYAAFGHLM
jgi:hypothetical protein